MSTVRLGALECPACGFLLTPEDREDDRFTCPNSRCRYRPGAAVVVRGP